MGYVFRELYKSLDFLPQFFLLRSTKSFIAFTKKHLICGLNEPIVFTFKKNCVCKRRWQIYQLPLIPPNPKSKWEYGTDASRWRWDENSIENYKYLQIMTIKTNCNQNWKYRQIELEYTKRDQRLLKMMCRHCVSRGEVEKRTSEQKKKKYWKSLLNLVEDLCERFKYVVEFVSIV